MIISLALIYFSLRFGYPWAILLLFITWIPDIILTAGIVDVFESLIKRNKSKR